MISMDSARGMSGNKENRPAPDATAGLPPSSMGIVMEKKLLGKIATQPQHYYIAIP
jgi:hypothetical protein